jgi:hypothetical protein
METLVVQRKIEQKINMVEFERFKMTSIYKWVCFIGNPLFNDSYATNVLMFKGGYLHINP